MVTIAYKTIDLRGRFSPANGSWDTSTKGCGVIVHYNGDATPTRAWEDPVEWIRFITGIHQQPGRFAAGWTFNGCAYHEFVFGNTVYRVMNYGAVLPHSGNLQRNYDTLALHVAIGGSQRANARTLQTLQERIDAHLKAMNKGRARCFGHQEIVATQCPGTLMNDFVIPYRNGKNWSAPAPAPTPTPTPTPSPGLPGYPEMSRQRYINEPVDKLRQGGHTITTKNGPIGIAYPSIADEGLPKMSRYQWSKLSVGEQKRLKVALTYSGNVYNIWRGVDYGKEASVSNVDRALEYGMQLRGAPYSWWSNEQQNLGEGPPAWAVDKTPPPASTIRSNGLFCMAVMNLMLRKLGKPVPKNPPYNGGTGAYFKVYGSKMVPFRLGDLRRGDLLFRRYRSVQDQGHGAVALGPGPDAKVLQSFATSFGNTHPGCNSRYTARESHGNGFYEYRLPAKAWLG